METRCQRLDLDHENAVANLQNESFPDGETQYLDNEGFLGYSRGKP
jgi:hypothetical protein